MHRRQEACRHTAGRFNLTAKRFCLMSVILTKRVLFVSVKAPKIVHETKRVNFFDKTEKIKCQDLLTRFNYINDLFFL